MQKAQALMEERIQEAGDQATFRTGVTGLHPELVRLLGKMKFRTTLGQNALDHSIEVANIAGVMAAELHVNETLARRGGLLHDIGKAVDFEQEGTHTSIGIDLARRYRESQDVIHAIAAHHEEEPFRLVEAVPYMPRTASRRPGRERAGRRWRATSSGWINWRRSRSPAKGWSAASPSRRGARCAFW